MRILATEDLSPEEAPRKSMHQIPGAIIATTLVTVAIYVPIAFFGGMVGNTVSYTHLDVYKRQGKRYSDVVAAGCSWRGRKPHPAGTTGSVSYTHL